MSEEEEKDLGDKAKEAANEFAEEAKETAKEFSEGVKETLNADNKKILAGILAIVLGGFGVHKFILGYNKEGIILLICTIILGVVTCGIANMIVWVVTVIEGIIYLTKSDEEFYNTYQVGKKPWF
ncbi:MAG: TM2 domain-containing protein [Allomuricauda sp.]